MTLKADSVEWALNEKRINSRSGTPCKPLCHLGKGPNRSSGSWRVTGTVGCSWSLWQAAVDASWLTPWRKASPSSMDSYSPFEKRFSVCSWVLLETEHLAMDHQITMWLELPITNRLSSDPLNTKLGVHRSMGLSNGRGVYRIRLERLLKAQEVTRGTGPNAMSSPPATVFSLPGQLCGPLGSYLLWAWFTGLPHYRQTLHHLSVQGSLTHNMQVPSESEPVWHAAPFWDVPEGQWWGEILPVGRHLSGMFCCSCFGEEGKLARSASLYCLLSCGQWFGLIVRDLKYNWEIGDKEVYG